MSPNPYALQGTVPVGHAACLPAEPATQASRPPSAVSELGIVRRRSRLVKTSALTFLALAASARLLAGESTLTQTFQPLDGLGSGEVVIAPVMCHDWSSHSGFPTAIGLITAKNIPPTNAPMPIGDINIASASGLILLVSEDAAGRTVITLDCRALRVPQQFACTELQAVGATLECLRQVAGQKLDTMTIKATLKPDGQEAVQKLVDDFIKQPKHTPFQWKLA